MHTERLVVEYGTILIATALMFGFRVRVLEVQPLVLASKICWFWPELEPEPEPLAVGQLPEAEPEPDPSSQLLLSPTKPSKEYDTQSRHFT